MIPDSVIIFEGIQPFANANGAGGLRITYFEPSDMICFSSYTADDSHSQASEYLESCDLSIRQKFQFISLTVKSISYLRFLQKLQASENLQKACLSYLRETLSSNGHVTESNYLYVKASLIEPSKPQLDLIGCRIAERICHERCELSNLMAWLSTLGGASSALGDSIPQFADLARRITIRQLYVAHKLADPVVIIQCKLYFALSLIQNKKFTAAKNTIKGQYHIVSKSRSYPKFLISMCRGIWAKLKFEVNKHQKCRPSTKSETLNYLKS